MPRNFAQTIAECLKFSLELTQIAAKYRCRSNSRIQEISLKNRSKRNFATYRRIFANFAALRLHYFCAVVYIISMPTSFGYCICNKSFLSFYYPALLNLHSFLTDGFIYSALKDSEIKGHIDTAINCSSYANTCKLIYVCFVAIVQISNN